MRAAEPRAWPWLGIIAGIVPARTKAPAHSPTKSVLKALLLLERLAGGARPWGVSELARSTELDKATVHRLLATLMVAGYVRKAATAGQYELTQRLADMACTPQPQRSLMELALPFMRELASRTRETAYLAVLNGEEAVFLDKVEGAQAIRVNTPNGSRIPLHAGSAAKALLAFQPPALVDRVLARLKPVSRHTVVDPAALRRQLATIRRQGYAIGEQEWREGVSGIAAPVRDAAGRVVVALAISGPSERLRRRELQAFAPAVIAAADVLSSAMGYRG